MRYHLKIDRRAYVSVIRAADPNDRWDRDNTSTDHELRGVHLSKDKSYDLFYDGDLSVGDTIYIVYAIYSTGDSFGHDDKAEIEFITAHKNKDVAYHNMAMTKSCNKNNDRKGIRINYDSHVMLAFDTGQTFKFVPPWNNYFEHLDKVDVFETIVKKHNNIY